MNIKKLTFKSKAFPEVLKQIPSPPKQLYHAGAPLEELMKRPRVAIVGTRKSTSYGMRVTQEIAGELAEQGIVIISGLALGIDAIAHQATVKAGGLAIAVLPCPLDNIVPVWNRRLASDILDNGGALVSEYENGLHPQKQFFIARNRLMSGLADVVLITEATEKSGSLHTANFALQQGREVLVVPGDIYKSGSVGANNLIKSGASVVTSANDVLHALGLEKHQTKARHVKGRNANEQAILDLLLQGVTAGQEILEGSKLEVSEFNQALTMLEISGKIRPLGANQWAIF